VDPVAILTDFSELTGEGLSTYIAGLRAAIDDLIALEAPTAEQVGQAEMYADAIEAAMAEEGVREQAAVELAARHEALRSRFSDTEPETEGEEETDDEDQGTEDVEESGTAAAPAVAAPAATSTVATLARRTARPQTPVATRRPITITAAADVPEFSTGSTIDDMGNVGRAVLNRMRGFGTPTGNGETEDLHRYGVASFRMEFPDDLTIDRGDDEMEVLYHAMDERRLPGGSLVASAGWCAPSETIYDLCSGETTDGLVSVPEVHITRGGLRFTSGIDFSTIYSAVGFCQTEAQAISGTAKTCVEVPCPTFTDVRLDACGLCVKVPILMNAGYPELVQRYVSGAMIAHQHKMNAKVINAMVTAAGTAKTITALGTTTVDALSALELIADGVRSKYRLSMEASMEVVVPFWVDGAMRTDLSNRMGVMPQVITDEILGQHFAARGLNVQYVYDWQDTPFPAGTAPAVAYPASFQALIYPAGTFIKGTADIINLSAVYDAASLAQNIYTGLFFEQGILVAQMCYQANLVTIPICNSGQVGLNKFTCP
jgi:hypothetical protein